MPVRAICDQYVLPSRPPGMPAGRWLYIALREDIVGRRTPLTRYAHRPLGVDGLLLGFAAVEEGEIAQGVEQLAQVCDGLERRAKGRRKG
jgi:hypothetical protein